MKMWTTRNTGTHQGLVIEESTGRNVAITYDKADAALVAAAPAMLEALLEIIDFADARIDPNWSASAILSMIKQKARDTINYSDLGEV